MNPVPEEPAREQRISLEIVVDCYDDVEVAMGWYCYLDDRLHFPFAAIWLPRPGAALEDGERVVIVSMASEEECEDEILVMLDDPDELTVPLELLRPLNADAVTQQAVEDWHYWVARGYRWR